MKKYHDKDEIVRMVHHDESSINRVIRDIKKDLDMDNKYQLLRQKFVKNPGSQAMLAHNYLKFLECIDYFSMTEDVSIANTGVDEFSVNVGHKKQRIYQIFEKLLST